MPKTTNRIYARALGVTLRVIRKARELSVERLAVKMKVSQSAIRSWECGISSPNFSNLVRLSELLQVGLANLMQAVENTAKRLKEEDAAATEPTPASLNSKG